MSEDAAADSVTAPSAPEVEAYFARLIPAAEHVYASADGTERLRVTSYLTAKAPPARFVRSVRCVVLRGETVLALRGEDRAHVLPGGRREAGETLLETLAREMLEEAGWTTTAPRQIGVVRLTWLTALPAYWSEGLHFYPDFLWLIHAAEAADHRPEALLVNSDEGEPVFLGLRDAKALELLERSPWSRENRVFRAEALRTRAELGGRVPGE